MIRTKIAARRPRHTTARVQNERALRENNSLSVDRFRCDPDYDHWAPFYDFSEGERDDCDLLRFYGSFISRETRSIVELGCGTGVVTTVLARTIRDQHGDSNIRVSGVDISPQMLRIARQREPRIQWVLGSFTEPGVSGPYDLVICCFFALQHLLDIRELGTAFRTIRRLLAPKGVFVFDVYQPNYSYLMSMQKTRLIRVVVDERGCKHEVRDDWTYDAEQRVLTLDRRLVPSRGDRPSPQLRHRLRQYDSAEIRALLSEAGLAVTALYGDFDRSAFNDASKMQIFVCAQDS